MLCIFDVNETLLDLADLDDLFVELTGTAEGRREWFQLMVHTALTVTAAGSYRNFGQVAADCLPIIAARHGRTVTETQVRELGARIRALPAHPDAPGAIERLRHAGLGVVALTNSTIDVAEDQLRNAGLRDLIHEIYSADQVHQLKPGPEPYRLVLASAHLTPDRATMIAAHDWDIAGAAAAGLRTAFVSRDGRRPLPGDTAPSMVGTDLSAIADELIADSSPSGHPPR